jgi:putative membrane protein
MKGLFAAASAIALLAGVPAWAQNPASPQNPASLQALNSQDRMFLKQAGDGNLAEMKLGQLAMQKATSPAIKEFGRWMMTDHGFANVRLAAIGKRIGVANFQPKLTMQDQQMQQKLQGLSGEQFDRQYTQMMVRDHKETIPKFRKEEQDGQNPLLKTYAHNLLPVLDQHLAEAEQLAGSNGVAAGTTAPPTEASTNSGNSNETMKSAATPPATASAHSGNSGATVSGMGAPPAATSGSSANTGATVRGMGTPPGAASGSSSNPSSPTHFYNR